MHIMNSFAISDRSIDQVIADGLSFVLNGAGTFAFVFSTL